MSGPEAVFFWVSTVFLAFSFGIGLHALVFRRTSSLTIAGRLLVPAAIALTVWGVLRWVRAGHPPFVTLFESMVMSVWFLLLIYLGFRAKNSISTIFSLPVSGFAFLLLGWSSSLPTEASPLSVALSSVWLFIHASFATAAAAAFLLAASYAVVYLLGKQRVDELRNGMGFLPRHLDIPRQMSSIVLFGLILWGVMIVSGSIWAHSAWGRYWAWDPIELWSLISWLLYGLLLHLRVGMGISKRVFCVLTILAVFAVAFTLWGVHYLYATIHTYG